MMQAPPARAAGPRRGDISKLALGWSALIGVLSIAELPREWCAAGVAALTLGPLVAIWTARRQLLVNDPIVVLGAAWILAVTLPVALPHLYKDRIWHELLPTSLDEAARWMYRGWAAMCVAYWLCRALSRPPRARPPDWRDIRLQALMRRWIGGLGIVGAVLFLVVRGGQTSQLTEEIAIADSTGMQILFLLKELGYAYIFLYFYQRGREPLETTDRIIFWLNLAVQVVIAVGSASKYGMMIMMAAWVLGAASAPSRLGLVKEALIGAGAVAGILCVSYFVAAYRGELISRVIPNNASIVEMVALQLDVARAAVATILSGEQIKGYYADGYDSSFILDRFAHLSSFALFMEFIGFQSAYENALASAVAPVFAVIPSALIPDKVHFFDSADFARLYGWSHGGLSIALPGSFFWAWGYAGILVGMAVLGWLIAWMWVRGQGWDSTALLYRTVAISAVLALLDVGVTFQMIVIPAARVFILVSLLKWALGKIVAGRRPQPLAAAGGPIARAPIQRYHMPDRERSRTP
ncbi:hypothetical protein [Rhodomicrobium lacus]|uniref:hypothetical protein n=1 Tax=Rhodomicrobium lacus TaxID=2498452 RepID=UPI000F8F561C|nr:hypothetical protein [Rhodomicrobium lacus]